MCISHECEAAPIWTRRVGAASASKAQRIHQQCKGRRGVTAARVVEVISRVRRAPILEHSLEKTFVDMGLCQVLRHISQAESGECRIEHLAGAVEDELTFDADL